MAIQKFESKGQLVVPDRFRSVDEFMVWKVDDHLVCYPPDEWAALNADLAKKAEDSPSLEKFANELVSKSHECPVSNGKIQIPKEFLFENVNAIVTDMGDHFEVHFERS